MRRIDRLFEICEIIRSRKITTAHYLSEHLELSTRTIHRHINDLRLAGIPIDGSAGKGFKIDPHFSLPPLGFNDVELEALAFGARLVENSTDEELAQAARQAIAKINAVSPNRGRDQTLESKLFPALPKLSQREAENLGHVRRAVQKGRYVEIEYLDLEDKTSKRRIRPLGLAFWGRNWTVAAWCEVKEGYRVFRIDRIQKLKPMLTTFRNDPGISWAGFLEQLNYYPQD